MVSVFVQDVLPHKSMARHKHVRGARIGLRGMVFGERERESQEYRGPSAQLVREGDITTYDYTSARLPHPIP